jgi:hypothetical protein
MAVSTRSQGPLTHRLRDVHPRDRTERRLTGLASTRQLHLLDLAVDSSGAWATRAGGTFAISIAPM